MSEQTPKMELLLREALPPVEPHEEFSLRIDEALSSITALAAEELEGWELAAMRDPRNWARPAAALLLGTGAATALVLVRAQRRQAELAARNAPAHERLLHGASSALAEIFSQGERLLVRR